MHLHRSNRQKTKAFQITFDIVHDRFLKKEIDVEELFLRRKSGLVSSDLLVFGVPDGFDQNQQDPMY
jgi:hypothetical protein